MRKLLLIVSALFVFLVSQGQQLHFTSQYLQHNSMYNPAAAGIANKNLIGLSYRNMWSSFPGNPRTYMAYGDVQLKKLSSGMGAYIYRDETGPTSRTGVQFAYSYHINARNEKSKFGIGIELRALQFAIDKNKLTSSLGNDPLLAGSGSKFGFDAGFGLYYTDNKLSLGAAASQLMKSDIKLAEIAGSNENTKLYRHYNFTGSYKFNTGDKIYIIPNAMVRVIENSPTEYDLGAQLNYQEKLWWGLNWRVKQSWSIQAGFKILQKVALTYSYDYYETPLSVFNAGSGAHEIGMQFFFKK